MSKVPSHVCPETVVDYDYFNHPGFKEDPHAAITRLFEGRSPRIIYTPLNGGHWVIGGYQELFDAARNTEVFSSTSMQIPAMSDEPRLIPINLDPPQHGSYRAALSKAFAPGRMVRLEEPIRKLADELIDQVADKGETEFVAAISEPLPVIVFLGIAGVPRDRSRAFRDNVYSFLMDPDAAKRADTLAFFNCELSALIKQKRAEPQDDLVSQLVSSNIDDRPISDEDLMGFLLLLMFAGLDTVTNAMSLGMRHLATDPQLQEELRSDPARIPLAVEELLRRYAFANMGRILMKDIEFHGLSMKKGDRALFVPAGAGLDPATYSDPTAVSLDRKEKGVPTFGFGPHRCVGMHLARLELRVLYAQWLKRIPTFSLSKTNPPRFHGGVVIGLEKLPLQWSPKAAAEQRH